MGFEIAGRSQGAVLAEMNLTIRTLIEIDASRFDCPLGRWSSDIYEIYCRMSLQAALGVGRSIASQRVDSFESGFRTESLEMLTHEVDVIRAEEAR